MDLSTYNLDLLTGSTTGLAVLRFFINVSASLVLLMGLYYRRYRDKELVTTASMFNIFAFGTLTILSNVQFSVAAGFGLFAILALFSLRSEQISKIEITYFFGAIVIAVICSVAGTSLQFVLMVVAMVLGGAYVFDHPRLLRSADGVKITLDKIDAHALSSPALMRADLSKRLGVDVVSYQITALDYINDMARVSVFFPQGQVRVMTMNLHKTLAGFAPISLEALNAKAEMLARLDNKYIINLDKLGLALNALRDDFEVLDIGGTRAFAYRTRYYDDAEHRAYYDHHQRKRKRCKVRIRTYVDAALNYLEVKVIEPRATTAKFRLRLNGGAAGLDQAGLAFVDTCHREAYGTPFGKKVSPVLVIQYERITLVAREGGERLTIDTHLNLSGAGRNRRVDDDICIIETKSARGNGVADKIFRALHVQPTKRVSKFCVGMVATGQVKVRNGFLPALRKLGLADEVFPLPLITLKDPTSDFAESLLPQQLQRAALEPPPAMAASA